MSIEGKPTEARNVPRTKGEALAAVHEVALQSIFVHALPQFLEHGKEWRVESPQECIKKLLAEIPDEPLIVRRAELDCDTLSECQEFLQQNQKPSALEAYFLYKIINSDRHVLQFDSAPEGAGNMLPPAESFMCLRDGVRTKKFTSAIKRAVEHLDHGKDTVINVVDAGCGAIPILGICAAASSPNVRCVCLETNALSAAIAQEVVKIFGLEDRVSVEVCDATQYVPKQPIDLLVSETMNTGLLSEPLCAIMDHLAPHVGASGIMIPDKVQTLASSVPLKQYEEASELVHVYGNACPKVEVEWQETGVYVPGNPLTELRGEIPGSTKEGGPVAVLLASRVSLYGDSLDVFDSLISMPQPIAHMSRGHVVNDDFVTKEGESLRIEYAPGDYVGDIKVVPTT